MILKQFSSWTGILILNKQSNSTGMLYLGSFLILFVDGHNFLEWDIILLFVRPILMLIFLYIDLDFLSAYKQVITYLSLQRKQVKMAKSATLIPYRKLLGKSLIG